jgi:Ni/Fe-hydrogenase subunit HybB-like protein
MIKLRIKLSSVNLWLVWVGLLSLLITVGLASGILVFWKGLSITNLTDLVPWGLWITIDLSSIALSAGAFSMAAAVYLIGLKRYQPIARTATFIGLIGYTMALLSLVLDIGRPDRFWHALVYWNKHSLLWEDHVRNAYLIVLVFECLPTFASRGWQSVPTLAEDVLRAQLRAGSGGYGPGAFGIAPIFPGGGLRGAQGSPVLVQAGDADCVHVLGDHWRCFTDSIRLDTGLPPDA